MRGSPEMRDFVGRVLAFETRTKDSSCATTPVAFAVCEKLRPQWVNLMGEVGFSTLLSRALTMAHQRVAWLRAVHVKKGGSLAWSREPETQLAENEMNAASALLVLELLCLLTEFIGATMALRLMHDVWPHLPLNDSVLFTGF